MKRLIVGILAVVLLLSGCVASQKVDTTMEENNAHADHHVPQTRKQQNFFLETVDAGELTVLYLSYNEPDGCVTQLCELDADPFHQPELVCQGRAFYYICYVEAFGGQIESDGGLCSVGFGGEQKRLAAETVSLGSIVRTDEQYVYCTTNDEKTYMRADLALTQWSACSREEALGE